MRNFVFSAVVAMVVMSWAAAGLSQEGKAEATGAPCDNATVQLGWFCADCQDFKQENGDCCDPCACKGCSDNKKVSVVQTCAKPVYACEMGCPDSGATEPGKCPKCGAPRGKKLDFAKVIYKCPDCGDIATPILFYRCPKCNAEATSKDCAKCKERNVPDFKAPGPCGKCNKERVRTCAKSGSGVHAGGGKAPESGEK